MGYYVDYELKLVIRPKNFKRALEIFNHLHCDEMLQAHARGSKHPPTSSIRESKWYSWVNNPEQPYESLKEAFQNWNIVDDDVKIELDENKNFFIYGLYSNKLGQQDFLIKQLAPVLENTCILVFGQGNENWCWTIDNYEFSEQFKEFDDSDELLNDPEQFESEDFKENLKLAIRD